MCLDKNLAVTGSWVVVVLSLAGLAGVGAAEPKDRESKSLDEQLLEDLTTDAERPAAAPPKKSKIEHGEAGEDERTPMSKQPQKRGLDDELLDGLEGEDVSLSENSANENPLIRLNQRMKEVERRIADAQSDQKTQRLQHEISDDLSKLIAEMERQCSQCKKSSSQSPRRQQTSQTNPSQSPGQQATDKPSRDSSARLKEKEKQTAKADAARMQEMLKDVWGHLPPHLRQQMEQSANEEFLPKYELEIAEYFRSLVSGRREKK